MMFFKNLTIGAKLITLVVVLELIIVAVSWHGISNTITTAEKYDNLIKMDTQAAISANSMGMHLNSARNHYMMAMDKLDNAETQAYLAKMKKDLEECDKDLADLSAMAESQAGKQMIAGIQKNFETYRTGAISSINQKLEGTLTEYDAVEARQDRIAESLYGEVKKIADMGEQAAAQEVVKISDENRSSITKNIVIALVLIIISLAAGVYFSRDLSSRLKELGAAAERIAEGDLTTEVKTSTGDELGDVAANFEIMRQRVHESVSDIHNVADQVAAGAKNVSDASLGLSQGATEQAASVEELSASISEIASQTASNAENAERANALTHNCRSHAEQGNEDMKSMLNAMEEINNSSNNISKIIKVIDEIAFQTNILALNAAVEAARAGQHGKGFAVVAEEVRNLAARSAKAAKETTDMIEGSIDKVNVGRNIANKTAEVLGAIVGDVADVADIVEGIAKASNEQKLAIDQINQGVNQVSQVVQSNSATSEEAASASQQLSAQADRMREQVRHFKLSSSVVNFRHKDTPSAVPVYPDKPKEAEVQSSVRRNEVKPMVKPAAPGVKPKTIALTDEEGFGKY
ncbi:Methyl-accepting chemotaxis protein I (serine chemoreceptor protein) [Anaerovibrio sp. JC8]|uniref:methyl-accepting chemotaxis protein n=1 Tax=Anaerovibrio sp. JC8 TaxID=1240085 RepID=UPI000A0AC855|nr:methyl-accepting chemotaxis protein [Anaerovibrio sp. JC8]ORT99839.1 Methyl-accepting chemotaxis protein I (serine chemoreceptor protein) [Anaerovibrio sp. JC8]